MPAFAMDGLMVRQLSVAKVCCFQRHPTELLVDACPLAPQQETRDAAVLPSQAWQIARYLAQSQQQHLAWSLPLQPFHGESAVSARAANVLRHCHCRPQAVLGDSDLSSPKVAPSHQPSQILLLPHRKQVFGAPGTAMTGSRVLILLFASH